ncbi:flavodoxin domain-containing protein [Clostridium sp.]|uniref:flavodoxin domain-containing protein n=1 Tax=Clostridium sp. TaxID=1506 RepID=UPI00290C3986|nr:flavodoxin domain-containing protein [Clostridium sp.]MDU5105856.1 flavodoxin domain-containing protein [Clostridium sp.]
MKTLIIYCSEYKKNTEKIVEIFKGKTNCDLMNVKNFREVNLDNYDLIGFGSGVYVESLSPKLFKIIEKLDLKDKNVFVFSTSGVGMKYYNKKLIKALISKGAINKGSFACKGSFEAKEFSNNKIFDIIGKLTKGHPNNKDFKNAENFFVSMISLIK